MLVPGGARFVLAVLRSLAASRAALGARGQSRASRSRPDGAALQARLAPTPSALGHLPPVSGEHRGRRQLDPRSPGGRRRGQIADLAVHKGFAYLNSWDDRGLHRGRHLHRRHPRPARPAGDRLPPRPAAGYYHGEGAHVVSSTRPRSRATCWPSTTRPRSNVTRRPAARPPTSRRRLRPLRRHRPGQPRDAGRRTPATAIAGRRSDHDPARAVGNSYHCVFVWQDGPRAFLVGVDNTEFADVDIFDITDPREPGVHRRLDLVELSRRSIDGEQRQRRHRLPPRHGRQADRRPAA